MKKKTVFINGPMTTTDDGNFTEFAKAEQYYADLGWNVEQPHAINQVCADTKDTFCDDKHPENLFAWYAMMLSDCDMMVLLPDYKDCERAKLLIAIAIHEFKIPVYKAFSDQLLKLDAHTAIITAYSSLSDSGKIAEVVDQMPSAKKLQEKVA